MRPSHLAFGLLLLAAACSPQAETAPAAVTVADAWCRPTPQGARVGACYLTLTANRDDRLTGFATPAAARPEIHTMSMDGGVMRMRALPDGLALPAGEATALKPGAEHLMLIDLAAPLSEGEAVSLTLDFATSPSVTVAATVRAPGHGALH